MIVSKRLHPVALAAALCAIALSGCNSGSSEHVSGSAVGQGATAPAATPAIPAAQADASASPTDPNKSPADVELASKVESALASETALHGSAIAVKSSDGVVTLTGTTKDPQLRSMAAQIALSVGGVKLVRNELAISVEA